ncbi:hypothetical protein HBH92_127500 [Parastagonospora nodorum]|nr:hypothetical protein HBI09_115020 [Parastagonospora nodorum]KAH4061965.1 hypothetical protein HBH50_212590 [Parastagonospora nodorum]KAH4088738.1 hypothetical protein HBH48_118380 [Parastagonospora nodorum]KAH4104140.1 hypothetical protein HBH46_098990 [Parastagonospora nodorum]KAH4410085.1 hypothetical protein HBH92_127500 [Parastagonospora nodorum]
MSSITPASFVDDGSSFEKRILHPTHNRKSLNDAASDTTSAYSGSYIDDGADMLLPSRRTPGFGPINPKFYKQRKRKENENDAWNNDIQKAVGGDIGRSLEKLRGIGGVEVKRHTDTLDKHGKRRKDTITIPLPRRWGTFTIKADDGRVIVVDEDGEFDSGPQLQQEPRKWVKAPTTASIPPSEERRESKKKHLGPIKSLMPIPESEYEEGYVLEGEEDLMSPTGFFMTGGASGWLERSVSPVKFRQSSRRSNSLKPASPIRSLPGSWPSPPLSPSKGASVSDISTSSAEPWGGAKSRSSKKSHRSSRHGDDNVSTESYSTYKLATVEDAADTSSANGSLVKEGGWSGSQKSKGDEWDGGPDGNETGWGGHKQASENGWDGSKNISSSSIKSSHRSSRPADNTDIWSEQPLPSSIALEQTLPSGIWPEQPLRSGVRPEQPLPSTHLAPSIVQNWIGDHGKTVSEASTHKPRSHRHKHHSRSRSRGLSAHLAALSEASWDGFEKPKTMSDVSVAGTGSERSWPESRQRSRRSNRTDNWGGSQEANVGERTDSESGRGSRYENGYDEDNGTYLNGSWSGVKVRVRSRRGSMNAGVWGE